MDRFCEKKCAEKLHRRYLTGLTKYETGLILYIYIYIYNIYNILV